MTRKHIFPAGEYYIGDPCYIIPDEDWDNLCKNTNYWGEGDNRFPIKDEDVVNFDDGLYHWEGRTCFAAFTKYGDGCYGDKKGNVMVGVDSGLIGIIPIKKGDEIEGLFYPYTLLRTFGKKFLVWEEDGVFHFGNKVKINTK
jgi:hypothetical protein